MDKFRSFIDYWVQAVKLLESQFFVFIARYYEYFFKDVGKGDNNDG